MLNLSVSLGSISNLYDETMLGLYKTFSFRFVFSKAGNVPTSNQKKSGYCRHINSKKLSQDVLKNIHWLNKII